MDTSLPQALNILSGATHLDELYPLFDQVRLTAGWHKKRASLWKQPITEFQPMHWSYELGKLALDQAGRWMDTEFAERRNLLLFNPVGDNDYDTVRTLVAAYQMIKPGEYAKPHAHSPNALRFVLEAKPGAFSVVDGVKLPMLPGDVLLTPGGAVHSHYNESDASAYWIDILDVPLVHLLEPMFFAPSHDALQEVSLEPSDHGYWFQVSDVVAHFEGVQHAGQAKGNTAYTHTLNSQAHIVTQCLRYHHFMKQQTLSIPRTTVSRLFCVASGSGEADLGGVKVQWKMGDVMALPSWHQATFTAHEGSRFFEVNDQPVLDKLGFFRQEP
jgi:gentisate 1,2-dioxygenase